MRQRLEATMRKKKTIAKQVHALQQQQWHSAIVKYVQRLVRRGLEQLAIVELVQRLVRRGLETQKSLDQMWCERTLSSRNSVTHIPNWIIVCLTCPVALVSRLGLGQGFKPWVSLLAGHWLGEVGWSKKQELLHVFGPWKMSQKWNLKGRKGVCHYSGPCCYLGHDGSYVGIFVSGFPDLQTPRFCVQCCRLASLESRSNQDAEALRSAQGGQEEGEESGDKSQDEAAEVHVDSETSGDETVLFGPHPVINMNESDSDWAGKKCRAQMFESVD